MRPYYWRKALLLPAALLIVSAASSTVYTGRAATNGLQFRHGAHATVPRFLQLAWLRDSLADWVFGVGVDSGDDDTTTTRQHAKIDKVSSTDWRYAAYKLRYDGLTVLRFHFMTDAEEVALATAASWLFLDVWAFDRKAGIFDVGIRKDRVETLLMLLPMSLHTSFAPLMPDVAAAVRATFPTTGVEMAAGLPATVSATMLTDDGSSGSGGGSAVANTNRGSGSGSGDGGTDNIFFRDYQPYPVIVQWMKLLEVMFPFVHMVKIGTSAEGREIMGLRVGASEAATTNKKNKNHKKNKKTKKTKKTILMTGGMHAREWISSSSVSYVAWAIITGYGNANMITKLVDNFDLVFVPVVNPDGYHYTWETDRLWRKTRQTTNFRYCPGYDLDHAFGFAWDSTVRDEPCSETYRGEAAFQAVEADALSAWARREVAAHDVEFVGYLDLHAYSQQILFPYAYSCAADPPPNLENLEELAAGLAKAIRLSTGETYSVASACEGVMAAGAGAGAGPEAAWPTKAWEREKTRRIASGGGSAIDWFYHELKAKYSYQIKLRDTGSYGFLLPRSEIVPTGEEVFSAVKYFGDFLLGNNGIEKSVDVVDAADADADADAEGKKEAAAVAAAAAEAAEDVRQIMASINNGDDDGETDQAALFRRYRRL